VNLESNGRTLYALETALDKQRARQHIANAVAAVFAVLGAGMLYFALQYKRGAA
jgi:hypothetical protein